jgi:hypothetical protein
MRNGVLIGVGERLAHATDGAARTAREVLIGARGCNFQHAQRLAKARINAAGQGNEPFAGDAFLFFVSVAGQSFPPAQFAVSGDHYTSISGGCAFQVARRGGGYEHVVSIAERAIIIVHQLVMREGLARDLRFLDAQADDNRAAQGL